MGIGASRKTSITIFCRLCFVVQCMKCDFCVCVVPIFGGCKGAWPFPRSESWKHSFPSRFKPRIELRRVNFVVESALCALCGFSFEIV